MITVHARKARKTSTGAEARGVAGQDVDVRVTFPSGDVLDGEVTLLLRENGRGWGAWGSMPDHWVSGALLARLKQLEDDAFTEALNEIEAAAAAVIERGTAS